MVSGYVLRSVFGVLLKHKVISVGTSYYPTNDTEEEYVSLINYTRTMLVELKPAEINHESIFQNLEREIDQRNLPRNRKFIEIKTAENKINEYALLSNIIMGSDRYLYIEIFERCNLINRFMEMIKEVDGEIIEKSHTELVCHMPSKKESIRIANEMITEGMNQKCNVRAAVGMTGAASIERAITMNNEIGQVSGVGFTKLGGEYGVIFESKPTGDKIELEPIELDNYMFIDAKDSTGFISKYGRERLVEIMTDINHYIATESQGKIEGYREGGDDLIINFPTKELALKTGLDCAWFAFNNDLNLRVGIGNSRREAGERAHMTENLKIHNDSPTIVFDIANGTYAYYIPTEFIRATLDYLSTNKGFLVFIFLFVFILTLIGINTNNSWLGLASAIISVLVVLLK